ncbi:hypothetical protein FRC12_007600 [Ceratobasidium sp. 428]|nr:hypothetical protein FRC12_007600 [Ceratobasidium sp. 428]
MVGLLWVYCRNSRPRRAPKRTIWLYSDIPRTASLIYNAAVAAVPAKSIANPAPGAPPAPVDVADQPATPTPTPMPNDEPQGDAPVRREPRQLRKRSAAPVLVALPARPPRAGSAQNDPNQRPATCSTLVPGQYGPSLGVCLGCSGGPHPLTNFPSVLPARYGCMRVDGRFHQR